MPPQTQDSVTGFPELVNFRKKYPQYNDIDDQGVVDKLSKKYPKAYGDLPGKYSEYLKLKNPQQQTVAKTETDTVITPEVKQPEIQQPKDSLSTKPYTSIKTIDAFNLPQEQEKTPQNEFVSPDPNTLNKSLEKVAPEFVKSEREKEIKRQMTNQKLLQSIYNESQKPNPLTGLSNQMMIDLGRPEELKKNPYNMTQEEATKFYEGNQNFAKDMLSTTRKSLKNVPILGQIADAMLYNLQPENYQFVVADELRKKGKADEYADYMNNFASGLASLFTVGGKIHEGINTMNVIGKLSEKSPKIANALSSFLAGTTYGGINSGLQMSEGKIKPETAIAQSLADGVVWTVFGQVGTKDWLKLYKSGVAQEVSLLDANGKIIKQGLEAIKGKEKEYLARSLGNWLIDTGMVTGISDVTGKVSGAVEESLRKNIPLKTALQNQFTDIDLGKLGIEFAINSIFTGTTPRRYEIPKPPAGLFGDQNNPPKSQTPPTQEKPITKLPPPAPPQIEGRPFDQLVRDMQSPKKTQVQPKDYFRLIESGKTIPPPLQEAFPQQIETQQPNALDELANLSPEEKKAQGLPQTDSFDTDNKVLQNIAKKIVDKENLTDVEKQLQGIYPTQVNELTKEITQSPEYKQKESLQRQEEKQKKKSDTDKFSEANRILKNTQRKRVLVDIDKLAGIMDGVNTPEGKEKIQSVINQAQDYNKKLSDGNTLTLENLSKKKFGKSNLNELTTDQQQSLLSEFNDMKKQGVKEFRNIQPFTGDKDASTIRRNQGIVTETTPGLERGANQNLSSENLQQQRLQQEKPGTSELRQEQEIGDQSEGKEKITPLKESDDIEVNTKPTDAQKEAGNYKKLHVKKDGLDISIENPKGSIRSGKDSDGETWETKMNNDYGYIKGTVGKDKDHLDVFLSDNFEMPIEEFKKWSKDQALTKKPAEIKTDLSKAPEGAFAVKLTDDKIVYDETATNHTELAENKNIESLDIKDVGFISEGKFYTTKELADKIKKEESNKIATNYLPSEYEKVSNDYYVKTKKEGDIKVKDAKKVNLNFGGDFFIHKDIDNDKVWVVSEGITGQRISWAYDRNNAIGEANQTLESAGATKIIGTFQEAIKNVGITPRYKLKEASEDDRRMQGRNEKEVKDKTSGQPPEDRIAGQTGETSVSPASDNNKAAIRRMVDQGKTFKQIAESLNIPIDEAIKLSDVPIGYNKFNEALFEDPKGIRYKLEGKGRNIKVSEGVGIIPGSKQVSVDRTNEEWLTKDELKAKQSEADSKEIKVKNTVTGKEESISPEKIDTIANIRQNAYDSKDWNDFFGALTENDKIALVDAGLVRKDKSNYNLDDFVFFYNRNKNPKSPEASMSEYPFESDPRTEAIGVLTGSKVERVEAGGYEFVKGKLSDKMFYELAGFVSGNKAEQFRQKKGDYITIRKKVEEKPKSVIDDDMKNIIKDIEKGLEGITFQLKKPKVSKDIGIKELQRKAAYPFYSKMQRVLDSKLPSSFEPKQALDILKSGEIKEAEVKWSGIEDWLSSQKDKIVKTDLNNFLKMNELQVKEVKKGLADISGWTVSNEQYNKIKKLKIDDETEIFGFTVYKRDKGEWEVYKEGDADNAEFFQSTDDVVDYIDSMGSFEGATDTKYGKYVTPGGENYREILFTLPEKGITDEYLRLVDRIDTLLEKQERGEITEVETEELYDKLRLQNSKYKGQNHRGIKKRLAEAKSNSFKSSHWEEPNVFAHTRVDDRTVNGKKVLFIEEIQSDWAREGRKKGFKGEIQNEYNKLKEELNNRPIEERAYPKGRSKEIVDRLNELQSQLNLSESDKSPDMPFKTNWHEYTLKNLLRKASEEGYDAIAWTTGEMQAERYDLSKHLKEVSAYSNGDGTYQLAAEDKKGNDLFGYSGKKVTPEQMEAEIGKEVAKKLVEGADKVKGTKWLKSQKNNPEFFRLFPNDLKIGGEWAKTLYDKVIPNFLNKYAKKWGSSVGEINLGQEPKYEIVNKGHTYYVKHQDNFLMDEEGNDREFYTKEMAQKFLDDFIKETPKGTLLNSSIVHSLPITEQMKQDVLYEGQPLFQLKPGQKIPSDIQTKANELIGKFVEKGIIKFDAVIKAVDQAFGRQTLERIFPALKSGYTAYLTNADDAEASKMDSFDYVKKYQLEKLNPPEEQKTDKMPEPESIPLSAFSDSMKRGYRAIQEFIYGNPQIKTAEVLLNDHWRQIIKKEVYDKTNHLPENSLILRAWNDYKSTKKQTDEEILGTEKSEAGVSRPFIQRIREEIRSGNGLTKTQLEKIAKEFDLTDPNFIKEQAELAVVAEARKIINENVDEKEAFDKLVEMYSNQPNLTHRTNESIEKQQYSTPAPISYVAGLYVADSVQAGDVLEPSAGNGMLAIAFNTSQVSVNEIDKVRNQNLRQSGYNEISNKDAEANDNLFGRKFDGVITNPPFGSADEKRFNDYKLNKLEHIMAANALNQMKDDGRASIIIGGHNRYDNKGRLQNDRIFFNWLNHYYNVDAVLNIDGELYKKQGTQFPIRVILINGRKATPSGASPLFDEKRDAVIKSFEDLYNRIEEVRNGSVLQPGNNADRGPGGITNVQSPGKEAIQKPNGVETISPNEANRPNKEKQPNAGKDTDVSGRPSGSPESIPGKAGGISGGNSQEQTVRGNTLERKPNRGTGKIIEGGSGGDIQQGFDREPPPAITRAILESDKVNLQYIPESKGVSLDTVIPRNMSFETSTQLRKLAEDVGGDIDDFIVEKLGYENKDELYSHLGAEQIDATAMAIVAIEKNQGMIIGDMTGVGKGRIAASIIRYAVLNNYTPIFFTEKADLFSDLYRDLVDIGSGDLVPFIINEDTNIVDEEGNLLHTSLKGRKKSEILNSNNLSGYNFVLSTYSQLNSEKRGLKRNFAKEIAEDNIIIMDESHNASGDSNTGVFFRDMVQTAKGVTYLSATFAKRPDNMPVYAVKTAISEANLNEDELVGAIEKGGVALQEILSTDMVEAGQMIRREKTYEGIKVDYKPLTEKKVEHTKIVDAVTDIIRNIINFQAEHVLPIVKALDFSAVQDGERVSVETGTNMAGVDNTPFASKVFNVVDQLLFALKSESAANEAIEAIKQGKKPVIAVKNTMESFLQYLEVQPGDVIENTDFSTVLERGLKGVLRIRVRDAMGDSEGADIPLSQLTEEGRKAYKILLDKINTTTSGISISPIDDMIYKLEKAGVKVGEVTGRAIRLKFRDDGKAIVERRNERDKKKLFREFNNWENPGEPRGINNYTDMTLIINASGSTGRSAHSSPKFKDQRQRMMITVQIELNINTEIQKRGRINRTGQLNKPEYLTISSAIPAEQRLLMMAKKKLKSLDANVSSDQSQAGATFEANDFLNKYGDRIIVEYLKENREMNDLLLDPLKLNDKDEEELEKFVTQENAAHKVSGRVAILPTVLQEEFYKEIGHRYDDYIEYLESIGENDLVVKVMPLDAVTTNSRLLVAGKGGYSPFGRDSVVETSEINVLKKPYKKEKVDELLAEYLGDQKPTEKKQTIKTEFDTFWKAWVKEHLEKKKESIAKTLGISLESVNKHLAGGLSTADIVKSRPELSADKFGASFVDEEFEKYVKENDKLFRQGEVVTNNILGRYDIGRVYRIPLIRDTTSPAYSNGIFIGWSINQKRKNPYAPSAIMLKFVVADSRQMVQIPGSQRDWLNDITSETTSLTAWQEKDILSGWDNALPDNRREVKHIVTGNILQALGGDAKGQLISYTVKNGGLKRGILIKDNKGIVDEIRVPIKRAKKFIKKITPGDFIETADGDITLYNEDNRTWIIDVPASKQKGGKYYLDDAIKSVVKNGRFDKLGNSMRAEIPSSKLEKLIDILQDDFGKSVRLSQDQIKQIGDNDISYQLRRTKIYQDDFGNNIPGKFSMIHEYKMNHPLLKDVKIEIIEPKTVYWTREEIKSHNYSDKFVDSLIKIEKGDYGYEQGKEKYAVEITGVSGSDIEGSGSRITISSRATTSAYTEEIIHEIRRKIESVSPEVARKIKEWEEDVRELAELSGESIPQGEETFAQAMTFTHLGYASENPDVAEIYEIPEEIYNPFIEILNQGKVSSDVLRGVEPKQNVKITSQSIDKFRSRRQKDFPLVKPQILRGRELYDKLKKEQGQQKDVYLDWLKSMRAEYGKDFDKNARSVWKEMKDTAYQLIPASRDLINKVQSKGLEIDKNLVATHTIKGIKKDYITVSNLDRSITRMIEVDKIDEGLRQFEKTRVDLDKYYPSEKTFQLKMSKKTKDEKLHGYKFETEKAREEGREPETGEGNVVDFGSGLGNVVSITADKIKEFVNNSKLEKELGLEGDSKLKKLYREFLTAPQWFFDKEPQLKRIWDIMDRYYVRNVNEETAILKEDKWRSGKPWRELTDLQRKEFLSALEEYEQTQYELQRDEQTTDLLTWTDFADEFALTPEVTAYLLKIYKPTIETALDMVKDVDRYRIINETEANPYLENYLMAVEKKLKQGFLDDELEKAKKEFFDDSPNAEALYENELLRMKNSGKPIDEVKALQLAWINNPNLRSELAELLIDKKYASIDNKAYFPSSRLDRKYFLSAVKKTTPQEKLIDGKMDDRFFTTSDSLTHLNKIKQDLESQGYTDGKNNPPRIGKFAEAQEEILNNAITQEDILDLALSAGVDQDNPTLEKLVKTIQAKGFSRHFIPKRFVPGFEYTRENFEEAIYRYINSVPFYKNRTIGGKEYSKTMANLKHRGVLKSGSTNDLYIQELKNKIDNRDIRISQGLRAVASTYYLALSPSYLSQQIVQPLNTLLPYLPVVVKELGLKSIEAEKAFGEALYSSMLYWGWKLYDKVNRIRGKQTKATFGLDTDFLNMIRSVERQGVGKPLRSMELTGQEVDPRKHYTPDLLSSTNKALRWASIISSIPGIAIEDFTRTIGIRAFYNIGIKAGLRGDKLSDFISESIAKSYGPASGRLAKPPGYYIAGEGRMKPMKELTQSVIESWLTFKNFAFMNFGQWGKLWRMLKNNGLFRASAYKVGAQILLGGLKYMMWSATILSLMSLVYGIFDITEDPEEQWADLFKNFNKLVPGLGDALYKGVLSMTFKIDMSSLFAQTAPIEEPFTNDAIELLGGAPASALKDIASGKLPRSLRGFQTTEKYKEEGVTFGSRKLIPPPGSTKKEKESYEHPEEEITNTDVTKRKLGFTPLKISEAYEQENSRQFKSTQYTGVIRSKVSDEIIPLIEAGKTQEARDQFRKIWEDMKEDEVLTHSQLKSIDGLNSFISQVIITRLDDEDRQIIKDWKNGRSNSRTRKNRDNSGRRRENTR